MSKIVMVGGIAEVFGVKSVTKMEADFALMQKGEPMDKKRIVRPIISKRLIYIYNPDPIRFFFWHKPEGLLIANFRFRVSYSRCNSKNLNKLHVLIRTPLLCIDRNNCGTTIGNKHQLYFVNYKPRKCRKAGI